MKKTLLVFQFILGILIVITFLLAITEVTGAPKFLTKLNFPIMPFQHNEEFDPSYARINSLKKLDRYCDSICVERQKAEVTHTNCEGDYPEIASEVVRKKFYHGLSSFGFGNNYLAFVLNPSFTGMHLNAPVRPDDILKFPCGICSQQALVLMKLMEKKGFPVRKIGFYNKDISGHFCFEVYYNGDWHFFDPDLEPDTKVLLTYNRPNIKFLAAHPEIIREAYKRMDPDKAVALITNYFYGKPGERLAQKAIIYHQVTKFLSYTIWIFFLLAFVLVRRKYLRLSHHSQYVRNSRVPVPGLQPG